MGGGISPNERRPLGVGEVQRRVSTCCYSGRLVFVRILALFPFSFLSSLYLAACTRNSVYVRPVSINARGLRETPSRLGLHNNACCVKLRHDLVCITMPVA